MRAESTNADWELQFASDSSLLMTLSQNSRFSVFDLFHAFESPPLSEFPILNLHPAYQSLLMDFDPDQINPEELVQALESVANEPSVAGRAQTARVVEVPVVYGGEDGPDLAEAAQLLSMSESELIKRHSQADYHVAFLGFAPGFPYLTGLPRELNLPRKATPRLRVAAGSVAIGGDQAGVYPADSPGGWQIIGHTSLKLFDPESPRPALFLPGDRVRFVPVEPNS